MATVVKMPKWGLTMTAGTVTDWLRDEGSEVSEGDPLLTVETEKAVNDIEAPADGVLIRIVADRGAEIPVSGPIAIIAAPGETLTDDEIAGLLAAATPAKSAAKASRVEVAGRETRSASRDESGRINASPAARKLAHELGIDLGSVEATGPGGRVTSEDVQRSADDADADPTPREVAIPIGDGRTLAALVAGPGGGTPLVFVHGLGGSLGTWQVVLGELAERHRVIALDLPGHGGSDKSAPADVDYTVTGLTGAVTAALRELRIPRSILVGHSLGGAVAMSVAQSTQMLVAGLVLIDSAGLGTEISPELLELMEREPGSETARGLLQLFYEDQRLVLDRGVEEMASSQRAEGAWPAQQAVARAAFTVDGQRFVDIERLATITQPTLLVWGGNDRVIPVHHAISALMLLPDVALRVLPAIGHVPQVEAAPAVAASIGRFARGLG